MKAAGIDLIYLGGYHPEGGLIVRQAKEQGMKAPLMGGDALVDKQFWAISGPAGEGTLMTFDADPRSEEHTSELQSLMRISYAVFCLKKKKNQDTETDSTTMHPYHNPQSPRHICTNHQKYPHTHT